ncbi:family with sequence similarity 206, member A [Elysia marginata]|uniref:Family with sequence similarity 206, member A n=1 Tax=Elysia marginata TaxID=1093978 RepID=A0AAV4HXD4_9GAST|nr:family with sequence similarity 206, member A [Elysia marginata]
MEGSRPPSVVDRYFKKRYKTDVQGKLCEDQLILTHSNRICVVCIAQSHPIISERKTISGIKFEGDGWSRLENTVSGKNKRPSSNGYIAVILPGLKHFEREVERLKSEEEYRKVLSLRNKEEVTQSKEILQPCAVESSFSDRAATPQRTADIPVCDAQQRDAGVLVCDAQQKDTGVQ